MKLRTTYSSISEPNHGGAQRATPAALSMPFPQPDSVSNRIAYGYGLDVADLANDLEMHSTNQKVPEAILRFKSF
jgi:hypothetical protein